MIRITPAHLTSGVPAAIMIEITAPEGGIAVGGSLYFPFYMKPWDGLMAGRANGKGANDLPSNVLENKHDGNDLVSAVRSDGGRLEIRHIITNPQFDILSDLKIFIRETPLGAGETVVVNFGTANQPVSTNRKQRSLMIEMKLDARGDGNYLDLPSPVFPVRNGEAQALFAVAPSLAVAGCATRLVLWAEDAARNVCDDYTGKLRICASSASGLVSSSYTMRALALDRDLDRNETTITFPTPGVYYVTVRDETRGFEVISNPVLVETTRRAQQLYWGDIHVHSHISDGRGELADVYREAFARGLDFVSIADHSFGRPARGSLGERLTHQCQELARFDRPGECALLCGGETHYLWVSHLNLYFRDPTPELIEGLVKKLGEMSGTRQKDFGEMTVEERRAHAVKFWAVLAEQPYAKTVLAFFHHTMWVGLLEFVDPHERLIEICSIFGSSETRDQDATTERLRIRPDRIVGDPTRKFSAREALDDGHHLGFVGGSDNHDGHPGANAVTAVWAGELTTPAIFDAMFDRRCYATNAHRTIVDITANGVAAGQNISGSELNLQGLVAGDGEVDRVEIIVNGTTLKTIPGNGRRVVPIEAGLDLPVGSRYAYVRVLLVNGNGAFGSPWRVA